LTLSQRIGRISQIPDYFQLGSLNGYNCVRPNRIIIGEDKPALAKVLERRIMRPSPTALVTTFCSGQATLAAYTQQEADLFMVDREVPGMDGLTMPQVLRQ
jgi:CheY-like chemotaxis protein